MATATYQVFLPPPDLLPLVEPSNHALPISLHRLEGSASGSSRYISGSSSFLNYQIVPHTDSAQELQAPSAAGPSRPRSEARNDRQISANVPQNLLPPINLRDALPGALGHDTTDSLLSLDTTSPSFLSASIPLSQLPLLGPGGRDDADRSVSNLPRWHIPMSKLTDLATLLSSRTKRQRRGRYSREKALIDDDPPNGTDRYTMIVGVSSTETAVQRQRKEEKAKSKEGTLWIAKWGVVVPSTAELSARGEVDEVGCEVKLWESCAKDWGQGKVRRGDVIMLEGMFLLIASRPQEAAKLTGTTFRSRIQACFSKGQTSSGPFSNDITPSQAYDPVSYSTSIRDGHSWSFT